MPNFVHGKNSIFRVGTAGSPTAVETSTVITTPPAGNLSQYLDSVSYPRAMDTAETTTFGSSARSYIPSFPSNTFSISGKFDATAGAVDEILAALQGLTNSVAMEYGPAGNTTGNARYYMLGNTTGTAVPGLFLSSYNVSSPVGDVVSFTADFVASGAVSRGTYP